MLDPDPALKAQEAALRDLIAWRDWLAREMARIETAIATEARRYANTTGVKVRPTVDQLRRHLSKGDSSCPS